MSWSIRKILISLGLVGFLGLIFLVFLLIGPFLLIWAFNTLFNLDIQFNFWTWLAGLILILILKPHIGK